ncbi:hypothetical protein [Kingella oralis]|uniref:hypothetical protein n=1 Tax=Kingella oralis TaxID=505 RepID=UPI002D808B1A|nr:hypothetical protein [Kingella oralis]
MSHKAFPAQSRQPENGFNRFQAAFAFLPFARRQPETTAKPATDGASVARQYGFFRLSHVLLPAYSCVLGNEPSPRHFDFQAASVAIHRTHKGSLKRTLLVFRLPFMYSCLRAYPAYQANGC